MASGIKYYKKSLQSAQTLENKPYRLLAIIYSNTGELYRSVGKLDSALLFYEKSRKADLQVGASIIQGFLNCNLGLVYEELGQKNQSDSLLNIGISELYKNKDLRAIAETYREISKINLSKKQYPKALNYANLAYNIAKDNDLTKELRETSLLLSKLNRQNNKYKEAYNFLSDFNIYDKKITGDSAISKIAEMRAEFEISQNEAELTYHKKLGIARTRLLFVALFGVACSFYAYAPQPPKLVRSGLSLKRRE